MKARSLADLDELARSAPCEGAPLSELQSWMVEVLRHPRALGCCPEMVLRANVHFGENERLSPAAQLEIYRRQFWLRHTSVLVEHFPGLSRILGQQAWEPLAESYLEEHGRDVVSLDDLGSAMAEHLLARPEIPHQKMCVDMARLEWAYQVAFAAADDAPISAKKVAGIPPEHWSEAILSLASSVQLLALRYPVASLRRAFRSDPPCSHRDDFPEERPHYLVVYRREGELWDKEVSLPAFLLLEQLKTQVPLAAACEAVVRACPDAQAVFNAELRVWFTHWGRLGWIVDVHGAPRRK